MYRLLPVLVACLLAACASHSAEDEEAARAAAVAQDEAKCQSYGLHVGTPQYEACLTRFADQRSSAESANRAARLGGRPMPWATF
jgi:hypothetical protein